MVVHTIHNRSPISKKRKARRNLIGLSIALFLFSGVPVIAAVMSSGNYSIERDAVDTGGLDSSSPSYGLTDSIGESATGQSSSASYVLQAGYQQQDQVTLSIAAVADVAMSPSLGGIVGGTSTGQTTVIVTSNSSTGYTLTIKASSSPALQGNTQSNDIADYTPAIPGVPDFSYSVPSSYEFGYSVSASTTADLAQKFKDNGTDTCNTGSADTNASSTCWYGLSTTATSTIVRTTPTPSGGATSTIFFRLTVNPNSAPTDDTYTATTTVTAVSL